MEGTLNSIRPIIADDHFSINEKMELIEATLLRYAAQKIEQKKNLIIQAVNECEDFDKRDARIIINSLL